MKGPIDTAERNYINRVGNQPGSSPSVAPSPRVENEEPDFSEYMWMAEELEEFDKKVEEELYEQMFLDDCINGLLEEEDSNDEQYWWVPPGQQQQQQHQQQQHQPQPRHQHQPHHQPRNLPSQPQPGMHALNYQMSMLNVRPNQQMWSAPAQQAVPPPPPLNPVVVANSSLNPNAPVFVPRGQPVYYGQER